MFIPLAKIDEERRLVIGRAAQEIPDKSGEILDYATAKPAFQSWSEHYERATGGLSKGNLRVQHNSKIVAGKITQLEFDDDAKSVEVCVKVVDNNEWQKVLEGVYTGFSVGGGYGKKWKDPETGLTRYTPVIQELSLVDNPCIPTARIAELHKADGQVQELQLTGRARTFNEVLAETPRSFDQVHAEMLAKGWSESRHPREHDGKFARKTGEHVGSAVGAAVGGGLGMAAGVLAGRKVKAVKEIGGLGAMAGGVVGGFAGSKIGGVFDERGRVRRAREADRLEEYNAMKHPRSARHRQALEEKRAQQRVAAREERQKARDALRASGTHTTMSVKGEG